MFRGSLDSHLATEYGVDPTNAAAYDGWRTSHRPFHWFVEFYGIMSKGGFDVVIGNPPFVEYKKVSKDYSVREFATLSSGNLCYFICEQTTRLIGVNGYWSLVTPVASISSHRTAVFRSLLQQGFTCWISSYSNRPAKLFDVEQRISIILSKAHPKNRASTIFSSQFHHWYSEERSSLFALLSYTTIDPDLSSESFGKVGSPLHSSVLKKVDSISATLGSLLSRKKQVQSLIYYHNGPTYWVRAASFDPNLSHATKRSSHFVSLGVSDGRTESVVAGILNSGLFYTYFKAYSNCRDLTMREIEGFPIPALSSGDISKLAELAKLLMVDYKTGRELKARKYPSGRIEYYEYYPASGKSNIDLIDGVLANIYGFTDEELDFIINYDIKYRMGLKGVKGKVADL